MIRSTVIILLIASFTCLMAKKSNIPIQFTSAGQMYIEYQKLDFFLNQNLSLSIKDDICATIIDFTRPTPEEIKTKTGHRNVTE
ncbi:unnamed protein product [Trichobilharzia szidati]|nr:unnamed protein product [Trichobilharzia szidati]